MPEQIEARDQDDRRDHPLEHAGIQALYDEYSREDSEYTEYAAEKRYLPSVLPKPYELHTSDRDRERAGTHHDGECNRGVESEGIDRSHRGSIRSYSYVVEGTIYKKEYHAEYEFSAGQAFASPPEGRNQFACNDENAASTSPIPMNILIACRHLNDETGPNRSRHLRDYKGISVSWSCIDDMYTGAITATGIAHWCSACGKFGVVDKFLAR